jgi:hypothetical protein
MPPNRFSRHRFSLAFKDDDERLFMSESVPFLYRNLADNIQHLVAEGDTLQNISGRYYASMPRAAGFWWAIAQFQPDPINDPTVRLTVGSTIVVPSLATLQNEILNERRKRVAAPEDT